MRAILVIVLEVGTYQPNEVAFAENHNVFVKLPPTVADPAFGHRILPRTPVRRSCRFGAHGPHESHHRRTEDHVPIEYEVLRRRVVRERLAQLLDHPRGRGIECDIELDDVSLANSQSSRDG